MKLVKNVFINLSQNSKNLIIVSLLRKIDYIKLIAWYKNENDIYFN